MPTSRRRCCSMYPRDISEASLQHGCRLSRQVASDRVHALDDAGDEDGRDTPKRAACARSWTEQPRYMGPRTLLDHCAVCRSNGISPRLPLAEICASFRTGISIAPVQYRILHKSTDKAYVLNARSFLSRTVRLHFLRSIDVKSYRRVDGLNTLQADHKA